MKKLICYGLGIALAGILTVKGCEYLKEKDKEYRIERQEHVLSVSEKSFELLRKSHDKVLHDAYISVLKDMMVTEGLFLEHSVNGLTGLTIDGAVRDQVLNNFPEIADKFDIDKYNESSDYYIKEKSKRTERLESFVNKYKGFVDDFDVDKAKENFRETYIEDKVKCDKFFSLADSYVGMLDNIVISYEKDKKHIDMVTGFLNAIEYEGKGKLEQSMSNYLESSEILKGRASYHKGIVENALRYIKSDDILVEKPVEKQEVNGKEETKEIGVVGTLKKESKQGVVKKAIKAVKKYHDSNVEDQMRILEDSKK